MSDLLLENLTVLLALGALIVILSLVQLFLAINQDKRETNAGPIKELDELKVEIERKEAEKLELEAIIENLRKTRDENAESQAKAEYLQKRIEELQIEWNSLDSKRLEVKEVRAESEKVQVERAAIETALKDAQSELDQIQERLIKKDDLDRLIEQLQISNSSKQMKNV